MNREHDANQKSVIVSKASVKTTEKLKRKKPRLECKTLQPGKLLTDIMT